MFCTVGDKTIPLVIELGRVWMRGYVEMWSESHWGRIAQSFTALLLAGFAGFTAFTAVALIIYFECRSRSSMA